tara:strand:- start:736 stop:1605 length:870 start_codon:yes stop_codon:yes gene_type:complete
MNVGGAPLVLRRFQIDETGVSGANVWIEARQPGIVSFLLTMVGLDPNSSLRVTRGSISFQNSSVFGMNQVSTPLANIGAFVGGYKKPFWALVFSGLMMLFGLSLALTEDGGILFGLFAILALIGLIYYYLQKTMFMGFETSGGGTYGFAFKASVLEGVGVDINRVEGTIAYVNSLISSASLGETFVEQKQTQVLGGRQATMLASTPAPAAPSVYASTPAAPMPTPAVQPVAVQPPAPVPAPAQAVTQVVQASPQAPPAQTPAPAQQPAPPAAPPANQPQGDTASPWPPV